MSDEQCSFFLGSTDHRGDWARPRCCTIVKSIRSEIDQEYLWVKIDPPVIGQAYGLGDENIEDLLLTPRYEKARLVSNPQTPVPVYVFRLLTTAALAEEVIAPGDMILAAWGEIYPTRAEAEAAGQEE